MNVEIAEKLKKCIWEIYREGLTTASGGNISSKDKEGNIWISPSQIDKGFLRTKDFACVNKEVDLMNSNKPSMEFPFHQSIYKSNPEVQAVCHLHSPVLVALSLLNPDEKLFSVLDEFNLGYAEYAIPGSAKLGQNICKALSKNPALVIMQNHGVIAIGSTIGEAADKIRKLSHQIQRFFEIEDSFLNSLSDQNFDFVNDDSIEFYKNRAKHFLGLLDNEIEIFEDKQSKIYRASLKLNSLKKLQELDVDFDCEIIPESYLLLHEMTSIKERGQLFVEGQSLFNLYDRMEVFDFTAKVRLLTHRMGDINLLSNAQIQELEKKFLI